MGDSRPVTIPETIAKLISAPVSSFLKFKVSSLDLKVKAEHRLEGRRNGDRKLIFSFFPGFESANSYYKSLNKGIQTSRVRQKGSIK